MNFDAWIKYCCGCGYECSYDDTECERCHQRKFTDKPKSKFRHQKFESRPTQSSISREAYLARLQNELKRGLR